MIFMTVVAADLTLLLSVNVVSSTEGDELLSMCFLHSYCAQAAAARRLEFAPRVLIFKKKKNPPFSRCGSIGQVLWQ